MWLNFARFTEDKTAYAGFRIWLDWSSVTRLAQRVADWSTDADITQSQHSQENGGILGTRLDHTIRVQC